METLAKPIHSILAGERKAIDLCMICYKNSGPDVFLGLGRSSRYICDDCNGNNKSEFFPNYMNLWQTEELCSRCKLSLHHASGQTTLICPNCGLDAINAQRGRVMLDALKRGIAQEAFERSCEKKKDEGLQSWWIQGVPL